MNIRSTCCSYFFILCIFLNLHSTEWCLKSIVNIEPCVTTCCCINTAAVGYDYYCRGIGLAEQLETSSLYKFGQRCFNNCHRCCNASEPLCCMENQIVQRPPLTPQQNLHKCLYNCCLLKVLSATRSYCCKGISCIETVQNFSEYKTGETVISYCLQHQYCCYGALGLCGCLVCVGGSYAIMDRCTRPNQIIEMPYTVEN